MSKVLGLCPKCSHPFYESRKQNYCELCGNTLPPEVLSQRNNVSNEKQNSSGQKFNLINRYKEAYRVGGFLDGLGKLVKIIGVILGVLLFLPGLALISNLRANEFFVMVLYTVTCFFIGGLVFLIGIVISAFGQILKSNLDIAVHGSPFLTDEEKLGIISS